MITIMNRFTSILKILNRTHKIHFHRAISRKPDQNIKVCIIGSGPAGFYTAQQILKNPLIKVDIYEKLAVPFGLVRFGVAPDHPEVKNVINTFTTVAGNERCKYFGNVTVGKDVPFEDLKNAYHCVVLSYGADQDQNFGIPGENLPNVFSARKFVGWYNGYPDDANLPVNLDIDTALVIGQGNVAIDVARILLSPLKRLKDTDISEHALEALRKSKVKKVIIIGRRGPAQVAFTIKELRELTKLEKCRAIANIEDFLELEKALEWLPRPRKRLSELMIKTARESLKPPEEEFAKEWELKFLRTPQEIIPTEDSNGVKALKLGINKLEGFNENAKAVLTNSSEVVDCQMVLRSIGYKSVPIDQSIPFDIRKGIIPNHEGRVINLDNVYCSGWVKTGPIGVIVTTMTSSFETGQSILIDIEKGNISKEVKPGFEAIQPILANKGVKVVDFEHWKKIDEFEQNEGKKIGKPREKIICQQKMIEVAGL